jgi:hypothetical protein
MLTPRCLNRQRIVSSAANIVSGEALPIVPSPGMSAERIARDVGSGQLFNPHDKKKGPSGTTPVKHKKHPA